MPAVLVCRGSPPLSLLSIGILVLCVARSCEILASGKRLMLGLKYGSDTSCEVVRGITIQVSLLCLASNPSGRSEKKKEEMGKEGEGE